MITKNLTLSLCVSIALGLFSNAYSNEPSASFETVPVTTTATAKPAPTTTTASSQSQASQLWNLHDVDIYTLVNEVSKATGKNFALSPSVKGKVSFISNEPLTPTELYQAFLSILETQRLVAVSDGKITKILPAATANELGAPVTTPYLIPSMGNEMATAIVHVQNGSVDTVLEALAPLLKQTDSVSAYAPTNDLIVSSQANNLQRLQAIISDIDKPYSDLEVVRLDYGQAKDLVTNLQSLLPQGTSGRVKITPLKIAADERTNSIVIGGGTLGQRMQLRSLINKLDVPGTHATEKMNVIYLKQARAETLAPIINTIIQTYYARNEPESQQQPNIAASVSGGQQQASPNVNSYNLQRPMSNQSSSSSSSSAGSSSAPGSSANLQAAQTRAGVESQYVQWDESTNAIIVTAPPELMPEIQHVIAQLDIRRPQVLIQVIIAEVGLNKENELGIDWTLGKNPLAAQRFSPFSPTSGIGSDSTIQNVLTGAAGLGQGLSLGIFSGGNLRALLRAFAQDNSTNILATPDLLTLDNQPAEIRVGTQVSFAIGQIQNNPTGGNPFTSFDRENVGLSLQLRPQITQNGMVKLIVEQEISSIVPGTSNRPGGNPDTTDRYIRTTVTADNGQILVLGGLLQDQTTDEVSKVPFLGDLPVVGLLFQNHHRVLGKTNLMVFLRPVILYNSKQATAAALHKYDYIANAEQDLDQPPHPLSRVNFGIREPVLTPLADNGQPLPPPFAIHDDPRGP